MPAWARSLRRGGALALLLSVQSARRREARGALCNRWMRTRALPVRRGPADWLRAGTCDRHVAVLAQPAWCHWRRDGGAAGLGNGVGAGAALAGLLPGPRAGGGEGGQFSLALSKADGLALAQGLQPHAKRKGRGVSPHLPLLQHPRWISCASDPGFLTEEGEGGGVRVLRGDW